VDREVTPHTVLGTFETADAAARAVDRLLAAGFRPEQVSALGRRDVPADAAPERGVAGRAAGGAVVGAALGGLGALLLAAAVAPPGAGPVGAADPLATLLPGAVAGGLAGGLIGFLRVPDEPVDPSAGPVPEEAYVVAVRVDPDEGARARALLAGAAPAGQTERRTG
jgi:hypothetical protein